MRTLGIQANDHYYNVPASGQLQWNIIVKFGVN